MAHKQVRRHDLPKEVEGLKPFRFSEISRQPSRTIIFLPKDDVSRLRDEAAAVHAIPAGELRDGKSRVVVLDELMAKYSMKSPYFLKKMAEGELEKTMEINRLLREQGLPVIDVVKKFEPVKGSPYLLVPREEKTLAHAQLFGGGVSYEQLCSFFRAVGTLNALGYSHGHPHFGNGFLRDGKVGLFDFDRARKFEPGFEWNSRHILGRFYGDYCSAGSNAVRAYRENKPNLNWPGQDAVFNLCMKFVEPLPATDEIKEEVALDMAEEFALASHPSF